MLAAALVAAPVLAQQSPPAPPPVPAGRPAPTRPAADSTLSRIPMPAALKDSVPRDTVKAPLAVAPRPVAPEMRGRRMVWDRQAIFASGALTLPELLEQIPGVTGYHAGFIAAASAMGWYGEPGRVRVYLDGVELDALDARDGGVADLGVVQLWSLEEVAVERTAGELRVHLRSWRVQLTTPQTRTDILTGSENTNLYRGFYGKRLESGGVIQFGAQQASTTSVRTAGDGDGLAVFSRLGFARGRLTVDGVTTRLSRVRSATIRNIVSGTLDPNAIGRFEGSDASAYLRAAWGNPDSSGWWVQAVAATLRHEETGDSTVGADTARSESQYVASIGASRWGARLSATARLRVQDHESRVAPAVRASWMNRWVAASAFAELDGPDSTRRLDALVTITPWPWVQFLAAHSIHTPSEALAGGPERTTSRAEAGVRIYGRWLSGGVIQRSASQVSGMPVFDELFTSTMLAKSNGIEASASGQIRGPFSFDWRGVRWSADGLYRPRVESHAALRVASGFEKKLVRRTFHLAAAVTHDYRGAVEAPAGGGAMLRAEGAGVFGTLLEMRIATAHIFWYNRNSGGKVYETVPGYLMPRLVQMYGVRWEFWN